MPVLAAKIPGRRYLRRVVLVDDGAKERLLPGAYVLEASAGGKKARELILVTDVSLVLKTWPGHVVAFVCDAVSGAPIPGARLRLLDYRYTNG